MMRIVLAIALVAGCTVNKRSSDFECGSTADCRNQLGDGFACNNGICQQTGTPTDDGNPDPDADPRPDAFVCPAQCTSCKLEARICKVDCGASPATCNAPINCPPGFNCEIICSTPNGCANINCTQGESCNIDCKATGTCKGVTCGEGPCDITCEGGNSCRDVDCHNSCACDVSCTGIGACSLELTCPGATAATCGTLNPRGCTSQRDGCNTCP
jgi:hypothetical protein